LNGWLFFACAAFMLAGPARGQQTCDTGQYPLSSPAQRYSDNKDGTVTDLQTQLMWARCSVGQDWLDGRCKGRAATHSWQTAQSAADEVNRKGVLFFNDWRMPLIRELATIAERQCRNPRINLEVFPDTPPALYWTASVRPAPNADAFAFALAFDADGLRYLEKQETLHVRLVRSAR
jgi:Protein of unknown function (DUF1566)